MTYLERVNSPDDLKKLTISELKEYAKEAIKNNYMETIIDYDLKRMIGRVVDDIVSKEEEYWREKWEDACDNAEAL